MTTHPSYLPVALRLDHIDALVLGGGQVAANKIRLLLGRCPVIHVWAQEVHDEVRKAQGMGRIRLRHGLIRPEELEEIIPHMGIVFAATDNTALNRSAARIARQHHVPVCVVDDPEFSSFITPALVDRSPVQVAISTSGASPVLARRLRERLEAQLPDGLGRAAAFMYGRRNWLKQILPDMDARRRVWEVFMDGPGYEAALAGDTQHATAVLEALIADRPTGGEVWLVGAGPGHPDLLTLAALRLMQNTDCVLHDHLVSEAILDRVRRDAERICVGKQRQNHTWSQEEIQQEMIHRARKGERVLRLKGGDPFIFGRGGEEMKALLDAGVPVRVVPGITAASGCGAAAGIPLTHRECAQGCLFVTGHARADGTLALHWPSLVCNGQTVVVYMGLAHLEELCAQMQAHGLPPHWPMAVVDRGTCAGQRVVVGTLADMPDQVRGAGLGGPAIIFVGEVVHHRAVAHDRAENLSFFSFFPEEMSS